MIKKIGNFKTNSDILRITDPCYTKDTWCSGILQNCQIGKWSAFLIYSNEGSFGIRVSQIFAVAGDISISDAQKVLDEYNWKLANIHVGVDSGQAGIFEDNEYPEEETGEYGDNTTFYGKCCDLTQTDDQGGVLDFGVVSSSGYGDGSYECFYAEKNDLISSIRIVFLEEDNLEYDEFDYEESDYDDIMK